MSGWLAIGLVVVGLAAVAVTVLIFDVARGDVGGRHTLARARRLLVVATDGPTQARAAQWMAEQQSRRPDLQLFELVRPDDEQLYQAIHDVLDREHPDAIVMVLEQADRHHAEEEGTYARLRQEGVGPIDTIWVGEEVVAS